MAADMPAVELVLMGDAEYEAWRARLIPAYAADHVAAGNWTAEESIGRATREMDDDLPDGPATADNWLWTVRDAADGSDVGVLWVTLRRPGHVFIYDIEIDPGRRGSGFGSAALAALEDWARANSISSIGLHVFDHNEGARRLYERLGYVGSDGQLEKRL